jgi:hypothetical protein
MGDTGKDFLEFFSGVGLVREGLAPGGWRCVFANDNDERKNGLYLERFSDDGVLCRHDIGEQLRALGGAHAFGRRQVLGGEGHAEQRRQLAGALPARHHRLGGGAGLVGGDGDEGVEAAALVDAGQRGLDSLDGRDLAPGDGRGQGDGVEIGDGVAHGAGSRDDGE